jgi:hypothetical protein
MSRVLPPLTDTGCRAPPGRWGHPAAKPAIEVSTDPGARLPGIDRSRSPSPPPGRAPTASACAPYRELIEARARPRSRRDRCLGVRGLVAYAQGRPVFVCLISALPTPGKARQGTESNVKRPPTGDGRESTLRDAPWPDAAARLDQARSPDTLSLPPQPAPDRPDPGFGESAWAYVLDERVLEPAGAA